MKLSRSIGSMDNNRSMRRRVGIVGYLAVAGAIALGAAMVGRVTAQDWRTASQEPVGLAPDPLAHREAVVQVYAARVIGWRGVFGVHTWIAVKPAAASEYTVYEIIGWRLRWQDTALVVRHRAPDARWFGSAPELVAEKRGPDAAALIPRIDEAARSYPWAGEYTMWPGPNSNTFTAWVLRAVPELEADLPPTAIGKDYSGVKLVGSAPSGRGFQFSLFGLAGITASGVEGLEINLLGLTFGVNPFDPALKLPLLGRIGPSRATTVGTQETAGQPSI
jgi:uncharacterized protein DUF3750